MTVLDLTSILLLALAVFFFAAAVAGLLRFPDLYSRLHALTKADNAGLGCTILALMLRADDWQAIVKLTLIWLLVLIASATVCFLIASEARRQDAALPKETSS
jgi:multicomponent Na+:H+ antiporter subunit G